MVVKLFHFAIINYFLFSAPARPGNLYVKASGPKHVTIQWSPPAGGSVDFYKLQFRSESDQSWREVQVPNSDASTYDLQGLQPNTLYNLQMCAVGKASTRGGSDNFQSNNNAECTSDWSTVLQARTDMDSTFFLNRF